MAAPLSIEVLNYRPAKIGSKLVGWANLKLTLAGVVFGLFDCSVFLNDDASIGVGLPVKPFEGKAGQTRYSPVIRIDTPDVYAEFQAVAGEALASCVRVPVGGAA